MISINQLSVYSLYEFFSKDKDTPGNGPKVFCSNILVHAKKSQEDKVSLFNSQDVKGSEPTVTSGRQFETKVSTL